MPKKINYIITQFSKTQVLTVCWIVVLLLSFFNENEILAQGDYYFLRGEVDTSEILEPEISESLQLLDSVKNKNSTPFFETDTIQHIEPADTPKAAPLSINGAYFPPSMAIEKEAVITPIPMGLSGEKKSLKRAKESTFLFYTIVVIIGLYALLRLRYTPYMTALFRSFGNVRAARMQFEDVSYRDTLPKFLLMLNTVFVFSLLIYWFVSRYLENPESPLLLWGGCFFIFMLIFCLRLFVLKASAWIFRTNELLDYYFFNVQLINIIAAWLFLPLLIMAFFTNYLTITITAIVLCIVWAFFFLFRLYRGYEITNELLIKYPFYFFIYLCTLEISPVLVLYKLFVKI